MSGDSRFFSLLEKWSEIGLKLDWPNRWVEGAIYPREMVFFLARCESLGIRCIVESGRQDGYSTEILGEFARRCGATVYSVDYEAEEERARKCRQRLRKYPELNLLKGDANVLVSRTTRSHEEPTAILMDGPKGFWAMSLMFAAAARSSVKLLALHNLDVGSRTRNMFERLADEPAFYESWQGTNQPYWAALAKAEIEHATKLGAGRSLEKSSLGVMTVSEPVRSRLIKAFHPGFKLYQPPLVRMGWSLGLYRPTSLLFTVSHIVFG
jgi:hypothetical protein